MRRNLAEKSRDETYAPGLRAVPPRGSGGGRAGHLRSRPDDRPRGVPGGRGRSDAGILRGHVRAGILGDVTITLSTGSLSRNSFGRYVTDGEAALRLDEGPAATIAFSFADAINAFGIDFKDLNFVDASATDGLGSDFGIVLSADYGGSLGGSSFQNNQFFGLTNADGFTSVTFAVGSSTSGGALALDRLEFGSTAATVPVPAGLPLLLAGLAGRAALRRRA